MSGDAYCWSQNVKHGQATSISQPHHIQIFNNCDKRVARPNSNIFKCFFAGSQEKSILLGACAHNTSNVPQIKLTEISFTKPMGHVLTIGLVKLIYRQFYLWHI